MSLQNWSYVINAGKVNGAVSEECKSLFCETFARLPLQKQLTPGTLACNV